MGDFFKFFHLHTPSRVCLACLAWLFPALLLTACGGFHLRGSLSLDSAAVPVAVMAENNSQLAVPLRAALRDMNIPVTQSGCSAKAAALLYLGSTDSGVTLEIRRADGTPVAPLATLSGSDAEAQAKQVLADFIALGDSHDLETLLPVQVVTEENSDSPAAEENGTAVAGAFTRLVRQRWGNNAPLVESDCETPRTVVQLGEEKTARRVLTVSGLTGRLEEVELTHQLDLAIRRADGTPLIEPRTLRMRRDFTYDEKAILATGAEEEMLKQELRDALLAEILRTLQMVAE